MYASEQLGGIVEYSSIQVHLRWITMDQWKEEFNLGYETPQSCQVSGTSNEAVWVPLKCQKK